MKLTPVMEKYILHWGEMGSRWGVNRSVAQIHALLYLAGTPLNAETIAETLGIARSNVSGSLKELQSWELITLTHVMGDRRDHFTCKEDLWGMLVTVIDGRKKREIDPTLQLLKNCVADAENDKETPKEVVARIERMMQFLDRLTTWYEQISRLPKSTLISLMKMGAKISKYVKG